MKTTADRAAADEKLLTIRDVATQWRVSERHIQRLVAKGRLSAVSLPGMSRAIRFRPADVQPIPRRPADRQDDRP